jgi:hypothetical protein
LYCCYKSVLVSQGLVPTINQKLNHLILWNLNQNFKMNDIWNVNMNHLRTGSNWFAVAPMQLIPHCGHKKQQVSSCKYWIIEQWNTLSFQYLCIVVKATVGNNLLWKGWGQSFMDKERWWNETTVLVRLDTE